MRHIYKLTVVSLLLTFFFVALAIPTRALIIITEQEVKHNALMLFVAFINLFFIMCVIITSAVIIVFKLLKKLKKVRLYSYFILTNGILLALTVVHDVIVDHIVGSTDSFLTEGMKIAVRETYATIIFYITIGIIFFIAGKIRKVDDTLRKYLSVYGIGLVILFILALIVITLWSPGDDIVSCYGPTCPGNLMP